MVQWVRRMRRPRRVGGARSVRTQVSGVPTAAGQVEICRTVGRFKVDDRPSSHKRGRRAVQAASEVATGLTGGLSCAARRPTDGGPRQAQGARCHRPRHFSTRRTALSGHVRFRPPASRRRSQVCVTCLTGDDVRVSVGSERSRGSMRAGHGGGVGSRVRSVTALRNGIVPLGVVSRVHAAPATLRAECVPPIPPKDSRENTHSIENGHGSSGRHCHLMRMFPPGLLRMVAGRRRRGPRLSVITEFPTQK